MEFLQSVIPTGCKPLGKLLGGGLPTGRVSLVYGEADTGKSSFAIQCAVNCARIGYKTIFVDSDGSFSTRRFDQIAYRDSLEIAPLIFLVKPTTFQEQALAIDQLDEYITGRVGFLVVDTITSLYGVEIGNRREAFALNRELNRQVACLAQAAASHEIAVLITSQVRSVFEAGVTSLEPVATRVLKFWSDIVLDFRHTEQTRMIRVYLEKSPRRRRSVSRYLSLGEKGIGENNQQLRSPSM